MKDQISKALERCTLYLTVDEYNPSGVFGIMSHLGSDSLAEIKAELRNVIKNHLWSRRFYEGLTGIELETDNQLYEHLEEVWQYIFNAGPELGIDKYWH